jgi:hypothetical protein
VGEETAEPAVRVRFMDDLRTEMLACRTVKECAAFARVDANGVEEEASAWQACLESLFEKGMPVRVLGEEARLEGFTLINGTAVLAICRRKFATAAVAPDSLAFPELSRAQKLWLKAWSRWSAF